MAKKTHSPAEVIQAAAQKWLDDHHEHPEAPHTYGIPRIVRKSLDNEPMQEIAHACHDNGDRLPSSWIHYWMREAARVLTSDYTACDDLNLWEFTEAASEYLTAEIPDNVEIECCTYHQMAGWISEMGADGFYRMDEARQDYDLTETVEIVGKAMTVHALEVAHTFINELSERCEAITGLTIDPELK